MLWLATGWSPKGPRPTRQGTRESSKHGKLRTPKSVVDTFVILSGPPGEMAERAHDDQSWPNLLLCTPYLGTYILQIRVPHHHVSHCNCTWMCNRVHTAYNQGYMLGRCALMVEALGEKPKHGRAAMISALGFVSQKREPYLLLQTLSGIRRAARYLLLLSLQCNNKLQHKQTLRSTEYAAGTPYFTGWSNPLTPWQLAGIRHRVRMARYRRTQGLIPNSSVTSVMSLVWFSGKLAPSATTIQYYSVCTLVAWFRVGVWTPDSVVGCRYTTPK